MNNCVHPSMYKVPELQWQIQGKGPGGPGLPYVKTKLRP